MKNYFIAFIGDLINNEMTLACINKNREKCCWLQQYEFSVFVSVGVQCVIILLQNQPK